MIRDLLSFYANGEHVFGSIISQYMEAVCARKQSKLAEIMNRHGSDKATWHSYPLLYELLVESLPTPPKSILEVGIGSTNPDVVGNMGVDGVPGASHRAWREFLPDALIYGADYDVGCLFEEHNIHTFVINQYDLDSINRAWSVLPHLYFDVVIDDGAHTFEANSLMLDATYERVNPGGVYVIEDIIMSLSNIDRFDQYLSSRGWDAFIMRLPHAENATDNAVAVIKPKPFISTLSKLSSVELADRETPSLDLENIKLASETKRPYRTDAAPNFDVDRPSLSK